MTPLIFQAQFNLGPQPRANTASTNNSINQSPNIANQATTNGGENIPLNGMPPGQATMVGLLPGGVHMGTFVIPSGSILSVCSQNSNSATIIVHICAVLF